MDAILKDETSELYFDSRIFNLFQLSELVGRDKTLPLMGMHLFLKHGLITHVNEQKYSAFLAHVYNTYL